MKKLCVTIAFLVTFVSFAQNKDDITVIYYSAKFIPDVDLSDYEDYNLQKFYIDSKPKVLTKEKIKYLPTVILYSDGEEILKLESDISLKLKPENWRDILQEHIGNLLSQRF
jgi:hypothetical protein|tara:strand:- start:2502 stop:2837 length:336 start_codon:yes stop_codon:yes gene_type:complete